MANNKQTVPGGIWIPHEGNKVCGGGEEIWQHRHELLIHYEKYFMASSSPVVSY